MKNADSDFKVVNIRAYCLYVQVSRAIAEIVPVFMMLMRGGNPRIRVV